ncbi:MAG: hypothetical protein L3J69_00610 [Desulfobacula sp.]|nr:hypothetical protein [Desulfobacula sp.]
MGFMIEDHCDENIKEFYSAEFKLIEPRILYQFKVRKSVAEPMYAVVKEGSKALDNIKEGDVINMRYYSEDKTIPAESFNTKIKYITKDSSIGFKDHYVIGLDIEKEKDCIVA